MSGSMTELAVTLSVLSRDDESSSIRSTLALSGDTRSSLSVTRGSAIAFSGGGCQHSPSVLMRTLMLFHLEPYLRKIACCFPCLLVHQKQHIARGHCWETVRIDRIGDSALVGKFQDIKGGQNPEALRRFTFHFIDNAFLLELTNCT